MPAAGAKDDQFTLVARRESRVDTFIPTLRTLDLEVQCVLPFPESASTTEPLGSGTGANASLVIVANEIFRCAVPRKRFGSLARKPPCILGKCREVFAKCREADAQPC
jgi:hypothetical protein